VPYNQSRYNGKSTNLERGDLTLHLVFHPNFGILTQEEFVMNQSRWITVTEKELEEISILCDDIHLSSDAIIEGIKKIVQKIQKRNTP